MKDVIIEEWLNDTKEISPDPAYLDYYVVVETSSCKGHSRRISFWTMLKNKRIMLYVDRVVGSEAWESIKEFRHQDTFTSVWCQLTSKQKDLTKSIVNRVLRNVLRTGVFKERLQVWDMSSSGGDIGTNGRKVEVAWSSMIKDSENCATFGVMTDNCFEFNVQLDQSNPMPGSVSSSHLSQPTKTILFTRLCVTIHRSLKTRNRSGANLLKSSTYYNGLEWEGTSDSAADQVECQERTGLGQSKRSHFPVQERSSSSRVTIPDLSVMRKRSDNLPQGYSSVKLNEGLEKVRARMQDRAAKTGPHYQLPMEDRAAKAGLHYRPSRRQEEFFGQPEITCSRSIRSSQAVSLASKRKNAPQSPSHPSDHSLIMSGSRLGFYNERGRCLGILHLQTGKRDQKINLKEVSERTTVQAKWEPVNQWKSNFMAFQTRLDEFDEKLEWGLSLETDDSETTWRATCNELIKANLDSNQQVIYACIE